MTSTSLELDSLLHQLGEVGERLSLIGAAEGAAGNLSLCVRGPLEIRGVSRWCKPWNCLSSRR